MVKVFSDSTCDLSPELIKRYGVEIIPLYVRLGERECLDGKNISPEEIYSWSDAHGELPKTAAPTPGEFENALRQSLTENDQAIVFTISSSMSSAYEHCCLAAAELGADRVKVIDSANLSTGIGHLVLRACELAKEGRALNEIAEKLLSFRPLVRASFVVDTLAYLHRGGRCSGLAAMAGSVLRLHPKIQVIDGAMSPAKKYRGAPVKYVMDYVRDMEQALKAASPNRVFITHSGCNEELVSMVREYLESLGHFREILITRAGSVVSSHCGPGTLGVLYMETEGEN